MSLVVKSVARGNQKTVTFSSFDEWHTWEADAFRMKEVGKTNNNRTTSIATDDEPVNGASASSGSVIGEVVNTSTLRSNKLKKITSFRNVVAEKKKSGTKEISSSFIIDNDVKLYSSAPVQQLDVIPDLACDVSLLSNELEGNKLKIWDEDESVESRLPGTNILTKACMTVVDINRRCESSAEEFIFPPASSGMTCKVIPREKDMFDGHRRQQRTTTTMMILMTITTTMKHLLAMWNMVVCSHAVRRLSALRRTWVILVMISSLV